MSYLNMYQRPIYSVPLYVVYDCAQWMVDNQWAPNQREAMYQLNYLASTDSNRYRFILSAYLESLEPPPSETTKWNQNINSYGWSSGDLIHNMAYGEDPHMYYRRV